MNIYAKEWHKVKPIFINGQLQHGYDLERSEAAKYLKEGIVYTVEKISVLDWSSTVYLKEFPGVPFNTVHFEDYAEPIDPELISKDHSEGELPVDGLLKEQEVGEKKECGYKYFVSYTWNTKRQTGNGCLQMNLTNKVTCYDDINVMIDWLSENIKDEYGALARCVIQNYILIAEPENPQRTFTLQEMIECWAAAVSFVDATDNGRNGWDKQQYFKEKFNIDLNK